MGDFKVGDLIVPLPEADEHYSITGGDMELAEVVDVYPRESGINIKILSHRRGVAGYFPVDKKYFCKVNDDCNSQTNISSLFRNV